MLFSKPEYTEFLLPFRFVHDPVDEDCGGISIEVYGPVCGKMKYCFASYRLKDPRMYDNGDYAALLALLQNTEQKTVTVAIKMKKGVPKDFKIDLDSLANAYDDRRFHALELLCWGFNEEPFAGQPMKTS